MVWTLPNHIQSSNSTSFFVTYDRTLQDKMLFGLGHTAFVGHASGGGSGDYFFVCYSVFYFSSSRNSPF